MSCSVLVVYILHFNVLVSVFFPWKFDRLFAGENLAAESRQSGRLDRRFILNVRESSA